MNFQKLALKRFSARGYQDLPVSEDDLNRILEAGRMAPSAVNRQHWHFIVVTDTGQKQKLSLAYGRDWFWTAPLIIVVCVEPARAWIRSDGVNYAFVDGAIAMDHMTLCATELGLGTCWIGAFDSAKLKEALNLPDGIEPVAMTPVGKPLKTEGPKSRKPLSEILHRETW